MIGGTISYAYLTYKSEYFGEPHDVYDLRVNPNIGYLLVDKTVVGLKTSIDKSGVRSSGTTKYTHYTDFKIGPFVRYYFLVKDKILNLLSEASYQYGFEGSKDGHTSKNIFSFSAGPVAYFNSSVGLEFLVSYSTYKFSAINGSDGTIQFGLGLQVHLESGK